MAIIPTTKFVFDRKHQATKDVKGNIDLRITFNRKQKFVFTGVKCFSSQWNDKTQTVRNSPDAISLNELLAKLNTRVLKIISEMVDRDSIDLDAIPTLLKNKSADKTFIQYIRERMSKKTVTENTKKAYHVFLSRFVEWGGIRFFSDISEKNIRAWDEYLHDVKWAETDRYGAQIERKYSQATIGSMHKNLKLFINDALVDKYIEENPYSTKRIKIDKGSTRIDQFLTKEEIERLENAKMPTQSLAEAKDLFLIQVYTGLAYADLMTYNFTPCKGAEDYAVFNGIRKKTGVLFTFVLTPKAKQILKRYKYVLPKLPNQKYNVKLKLIADAAGIDKSISSHDGRRSCGYILLNAGVPIAIVSRILGHSTIQQTQSAYAQILNDTVAKEIKKHIKE